MSIRSFRNRNKQNKNLTLVGRSFLMTAVAAAVVSSAASAQTNASSGINRRGAEGAAQAPASTRRGTAPVVNRAKAPARQVSKPAARQTARRTSSQRPVKVIIRGNRDDVRQARQQGMQSLQNANAAIAARNAERTAAATAAAEANANNQALANAQTNMQSPYMYGFVPGGLNNPIASYGAGIYGAVPTTPGVIVGATPYGSPNLSFPSYYNTYNPGVFSTYSTFGNFSPYGF